MDKALDKKIFYILILSFLPLLFTFNGLVTNKIYILNLIILNISIYYFARKLNASSLYVLISIVMLQNLFLVVFSSVMPSSIMNMYILSKEVFVIIMVIYAFVRHKRNINVLDLLVAFLAIVILYSFVTSDANIKAKLANARQIIIPIVLFYFGYMIKVKDNYINDIYKFIIKLGMIAFIIGFIQFLIGEKLFDYIDVTSFYANKGLAGWISNGKYPVSFVAWDLHQIFGAYIIRFLSVFYEALTAGHIMALCFVISIFEDSIYDGNNMKRGIYSILFLLGVLLTFSKGAYLVVLVAILFKVYTLIKSKRAFYSLLSLSLVVICSLVFVLWDKVISIQMHAKGFINNILSARLFSGEGLGNIGVYANAFAENNKSHGESLMGNLSGQFGIIIMIAYLLIIIIMIYSNVISRKTSKIIPIILVVSVLLEMFLSESSVAFLSTGLYFVISGLCSDIDKINIINFR
ncbi:MAG: hypothetical protein E7212_14595 [Clostridium sartagoforme]|nr:hypothetical protein [Clostridium sartagoforme]